jgi:hypothetical protein
LPEVCPHTSVEFPQRNCKNFFLVHRYHFAKQRQRLIPLAPALPTFGDERAIEARLQPATDEMLIAPEATA